MRGCRVSVWRVWAGLLLAGLGLAARLWGPGWEGGCGCLWARALSASGSLPFVSLVGVVLFLWAARAGGWCLGCGLGLPLALGGVLVAVLKPGVGLPRPPGFSVPLGGLASLDRYGWPSGHSLASTVLADWAVGVLGPAGLAAWAWAAGVMVSRVVLGAHYLGDVLGGAGLGLALRGLFRGGCERW